MSFSRDDLIRALPYARRYARALSGAQSTGDGMVATALREALQTGLAEDHGLVARHALFAAITRTFFVDLQAGRLAAPQDDGVLQMTQRVLLLLTALEDVPMEAAARILGIPQDEAAEGLRAARQRLRSAAAADVLIIEDEPIIAMDIEELVQSCGHNVVGVACSEAEAVAIAAKHPPGLILADINLGLGGDGAAAVARIVKHLNVPVIFVTAYPERLLTGEAVEPTFIITKPFEPMTLAIATYQAVTGGVALG